jgi:hypothetical protein
VESAFACGISAAGKQQPPPFGRNDTASFLTALSLLITVYFFTKASISSGDAARYHAITIRTMIWSP